MTQELVRKSLLRAIEAKHPTSGLMHHSDRGSQYCSYDYRQLLKYFDMKVSMSGNGNCFDNAPMESFWGTLKQELLYQSHFYTRQAAIRTITEYIDLFYNRQRLQAKLGYL
jgi:transposase InsO family protein